MNGLNHAEFRIVLAELRAQHAAAAAAAKNRGEGWRHDLIAARRKLLVQVGKLSGLLNAAEDGDDVRALRHALSRMRSESALHQANWPTVKIDLADPDYRASLHDVINANREFTSLAERLLTPPR